MEQETQYEQYETIGSRIWPGVIALVVGVPLSLLVIHILDNRKPSPTTPPAPPPPITLNIPDPPSDQDMEKPFKAKPVAAPDFAPPVKSVKAGVYSYAIEWRRYEDMAGYFGITSFNFQKIILNAGMSPGLARETLFHELFHASMIPVERAGGHDESDDGFIGSASPGLLGVLQDNPELADWLLARGHRYTLKDVHVERIAPAQEPAP